MNHPDPICTEKGFIAALESIRGVKAARLEFLEPGKVLVTIRYKLWTYLWFGLNKKASKRVHAYIYDHKPCNVSIGCKTAPVKISYHTGGKLMACVACMEIPTKGKCILDGCAVCCHCGRVIKPDAIVDTTLDKSKVYWRDGLSKVFSDTDVETTKKQVEKLARENLKKILGKDAYLVKISIVTDPDDPDAVNLTFSGPTELVEKIDEYNRGIKQ